MIIYANIHGIIYGNIHEITNAKIHRNSIRHREIRKIFISLEVLCFKEKGKFKIYLRYEKQWMVLFGHGNLKLVKKKMPFHLNHRTNQSARLIIMVSLDVGEH